MLRTCDLWFEFITSSPNEPFVFLIVSALIGVHLRFPSFVFRFPFFAPLREPFSLSVEIMICPE